TVALPSEEALNRVAIVVTLDLGDQLITVINTHLTFQSPSDQLGQVDSIIAITDDLTTPYIVMGDFNTVLAQSEESPRDITEDPSYIALTEAYRDGYVEAGGAADETTSYFFESEGLANARIDYIWLSSEWTVGASSAQVLGDESISDHRAIAIVVSL
ncbi:MAG: endonuclease/exonuclease/phosphatase family protein, partial [Candidatus Kariarchaeaceae archaeon]